MTHHDPFDPFGQEPVTPPHHEEPTQETDPTQEGQSEQTEQNTPPHTPLYGPDFFTGPRPGGTGYNPYGGGGSFYGGPTQGSGFTQNQGNASQSGDSFFGDSYFQSGNQPHTPPVQRPQRDKKASIGLGLGIASLVLSTICCCGFGFFLALPLGIAGLVLCIMANKQTSSPMGIAGMILSILGILFSCLMLLLFVTGNIDYNLYTGESNPGINDLTFFLERLF